MKRQATGWCHSCEEGNKHDLLGNLSDPESKSRRQKTLLLKPWLHNTFEDADFTVVEHWDIGTKELHRVDSISLVG